MQKTKEEIPEEEVKVKQSICPKCEGIVRVAISHMMDKRSIKEFGSEVFEYNLSVKEISLIEYQNSTPKWCRCDEGV